MSRARAVPVVALLATALATGPAPATTYCRLLVDPPRDETPHPAVASGTLGDWPDYDAVGADVATDARDMTLVVRLRGITPMTAPFGGYYRLTFWVGEAEYAFQVERFPDKTDAWVSTWEVTGGSVVTPTTFAIFTPVVDVAHGELRGTVALSAFPKATKVRRGTQIRLKQVSTVMYVGTSAVHPTGDGMDTATDGPAAYRAGAPSCVRVGR